MKLYFCCLCADQSSSEFFCNLVKGHLIWKGNFGVFNYSKNELENCL